MTWRSRIPEVIRQMHRADREGIAAATANAEKEIRARLAQGYTTGAFNTGEIARSVGTVVRGSVGRVMTDSVAAVNWEIGHFNLYLKRHVRVEVWRPAIEQHVTELARAYAQTFKRVLGA